MRMTESRLRRVIRQVILESLNNKIGRKEEEVIDNVISDYFSGNIVKTESDSEKTSPEGEKLGEEVLKQAKENSGFEKALSEEFSNKKELFNLTTKIARYLMDIDFVFSARSGLISAASAFLLKFSRVYEKTK
jgi:hypothetical protein